MSPESSAAAAAKEPRVADGSGRRDPAAALPDRRRSAGRLRRWLRIGLMGILVLLLIALAVVMLAPVGYAPVPSLAKVINAERAPMPAYDVWGQSVTAEQAAELMATTEGRRFLSPAYGAVRIDDELLQRGRDAFYTETFESEYFITDVLGTLEGPITGSAITRAALAVGAGWTTDLKVRLQKDITIGDRAFQKVELVSTGIDVPRGWSAPLGFKTRLQGGRMRVAITCAACHVAVDPRSGDIIEGAPNRDLNMGLLLAMSNNPGAYFGRTDVDVANRPDLYPERPRMAPTSDGGEAPLPDPELLNAAVREVLIKWPPGTFDTMVDLEAAPTHIPDSFTRGDDPYGWTGFAGIGPFAGLASLGNNVHAFNTDPTMEAHFAPVAFDLDPETYLAIMLQGAASEDFRYDPASGKRPSEFMAEVSRNPGSPGLGQSLRLPTWPRASALAPHSVIVTRPDETVWHSIIAMAAFQNALVAPPAPIARDPALVERGRAVFEAAGCIDCHAGPAGTNNRVIAASEVGTEPVRARALADTRKVFDPQPMAHPWDTPTAEAGSAPAIPVPITREPGQIEMAMGHDGEGGYKVKGLVGLYWSAPYLHMGDVAVGPDRERDLGVPGTLLRGIMPDAHNSLLALIDRDLRQRIIDANSAHPDMVDLNVLGVGHDFWVDAGAGFSDDDQRAVILFLLTWPASAEGPVPPHPTRPPLPGEEAWR
jgi:hypothetical protein